jgi:hypothetical protein
LACWPSVERRGVVVALRAARRRRARGRVLGVPQIAKQVLRGRAGGPGRDGVTGDLGQRPLQREVDRVERRTIVNEQRAIDVDRRRIDRRRCKAEVDLPQALERQRIGLDGAQPVELCNVGNRPGVHPGPGSADATARRAPDHRQTRHRNPYHPDCSTHVASSKPSTLGQPGKVDQGCSDGTLCPGGATC